MLRFSDETVAFGGRGQRSEDRGTPEGAKKVEIRKAKIERGGQSVGLLECVRKTEPQSSKSTHLQRSAFLRRRFISLALAISSSISVILRRASNCQRWDAEVGREARIED